MTKKTSKTAILLCTYNSRKFLAEQLDSFSRQSYANWTLHISDDGSQDNTLEIIKSYEHSWGCDKVSTEQGPKQGFAINFLSLVKNNNIQADYYAYSDHDDIWWNDKLERATTWLDSIPKDIPALYCSRTSLVDDGLNNIGLSPLFTRTPSFNNAIIQSIGGGNTMVFNHAARQLLKEIKRDEKVVSHDWLTYQVVTGCGGEVFYDSHPTLNYRQHDDNIIGANNSKTARFERVKAICRGGFRDWNTKNISVLDTIKPQLTPESLAVLEQVSLLRSDNLLVRIKAMMRLTIYRQSLIDNLGLCVAIIFKRV